MGGVVSSLNPVNMVSDALGFGAANSVVGGILGGGSDSSAYDTSGLERAKDEQVRLLNKIYEENVERQQPFYDIGLSSTNQLANLLGLEGYDTGDGFGSLAQQITPEQVMAGEGYQFRQAEGQKAIDRALAAQGKTFSPEAVKSLMSFNQGLASEEYGNEFARQAGQQQDLFNRLATISGYGTGASSAMANLGQNYGSQVGDLTTSLAQSQLASNQAREAANQSMFNTLLGGGLGIGAAALMSDERTKENIRKVGEEKGFNIYEYNYKGDDKVYRGVMAQEVQKVAPEAVIEKDGVLRVDYDKLGIKMEAK